MSIAITSAHLESIPSTPAALPCPSPVLRAVVRRVAVSITIACAIPAAVFYSVMMLSDVWVAIGAALCWQYGALAWRAATGRRTSGLLVLAAAIMTGRTLVSFVAHSSFLYFLQPVVSDCLIGTAFLASLFASRTIVERLAGDFYPMTDEVAARPGVQRLFRLLTLLWAVLYLGKASLTLWLLTSQSLETFVLVKSISVLAINLGAAAATIAIAAAVGRREGLVAAPVVS
ncbi:MAG: VC0807 family protein [Nocardioides sp.]